MLKNTLIVMFFSLGLLACGGTNHDATARTGERGCPEGGHPPAEAPGGGYEACAVLFEGCCYAEESDACRAAGCGDSCDLMDSDPAQVGRCEASSSCPPGGVTPESGPNGVPENCEILFEGCCFADTSDACRAAGCGDTCTYLQSYPGQLGRCE